MATTVTGHGIIEDSSKYALPDSSVVGEMGVIFTVLLLITKSMGTEGIARPCSLKIKIVILIVSWPSLLAVTGEAKT